MDAVEFIKEYRRICNQYSYSEACGEGCSNECALYGEHCNLACNDMNANDVVYRVEQWSQSHPQKTMMQDFFEKFPDAPKHEDGLPCVCPVRLGYVKRNNTNYWESECDKFDSNCLKCWSRLLEN